MKVLFICTGNTCRSPMAEAVFNHYCHINNLNHIAYSKGLNVMCPQPVSLKSLKSLEKKHIVTDKKMSSQLVNEDVKNADLILTMTSAHKMTLKSFFPEFKNKIFTLNEKAFGKDSDIGDPFGSSQEVYDQCCEEISAAVGELLCSI